MATQQLQQQRHRHRRQQRQRPQRRQRQQRSYRQRQMGARYNTTALRALASASAATQRLMIADATKDLIFTLVRLARDIIKGRLSVTSTQLKRIRPYERTLKDFIGAKTLSKRKRALQTGGFLGALLKPILGLLGNALLGGR